MSADHDELLVFSLAFINLFTIAMNDEPCHDSYCLTKIVQRSSTIKFRIITVQFNNSIYMYCIYPFRRPDPPLCVLTQDSMAVDEIGKLTCFYMI